MGVIGTTVGKRIRRYRQEKGLTQWQLSQAANVTPATIFLLERGDKKCTKHLVRAIASALGVSEADIYGKKKEEENI